MYVLELDVVAFRNAVEDQAQLVPRITHLDHAPDELLGLVKRRDTRRGDQIQLVQIVQHGQRDGAQRAAQIHNHPAVHRPHEPEHVPEMPHIRVTGWRQAGRGGNHVQTRLAAPGQSLPQAVVQPVNVRERIHDRVPGGSLHQEGDDARVQIEVRQQNLVLSRALELRRDVASDSGGAASAFGGNEAHHLTHGPAGGFSFRYDRGDVLDRRTQPRFHGRDDELVRTRAHGLQHHFRIRRAVHDGHHRPRRDRPDSVD